MLGNTTFSMSLVDQVRAACARVTADARHVRVNADAVEAYAQTLPATRSVPPAAATDDGLEQRAAFWLQLNSINFGSGWFPTLRKPPGMSGFRAVETGLIRHGPWTARELTIVSTDAIAEVLGQNRDHELMVLYARHLRELGEHVLRNHSGSFAALARCGDGSAVALAEHLATLPTFHDVSIYDGDVVPFFKRAQITASDLHQQGVVRAQDLHRLTLFADNLVPHVLRLDGVLSFDDSLIERIEQGRLIEHGSPEEVEIRACALHAVELLVAARGDTTAATVDGALWVRGAGARYKAVPRHRARCTAY